MKYHALLGAFALALAVQASSAAGVSKEIAAALADRSRPAEETKLDKERKPAEVLAVAGIRSGEIVGEYLPGGGYYTRLLSDIVGAKGKVYALETTTWGKENIDATKKAIAGRANVTLDLAPLGSFHLPEKVDLFWTSLNYHDLHIPKYAHVDMAAFNRQVFNALKPGGIYFILDHAAKPGTGAMLSPKLHRIDKQTVIDEVTSAGFERAGESAILHNPNDDHSRIVFDPSIRFRTDRFILMFRRPKP